MEADPVKIYAVGMDERACNTLDFFFQKFCNGKCEISEEDVAQVFLINMDNVDASAYLVRLEQVYPDHPKILTSIKAVDVGENHFLRKPLIATHLLTVLEEIRTKVRVQVEEKTGEAEVEDEVKPKPKDTSVVMRRDTVSSLSDKDLLLFVGSTADINLHQSSKEDKVFFDLKQYFVGFLRQAYLQAKQERCAVRITGLWRSITLFPESDQIYIEMSDQQLKSICAVTLNSSITSEISVKFESIAPEEAVLQCKKNKNYQRLDLFMWKIALWTSRGRLPQEIPLDSPLYLSGWPNLTRLILTPEALRICACWVPHPRTVINLTELFTTPQRYVFSFITATYVLGMSDLASRQADVLILPSDIEPTTKLNFFSRIMKKLRTKEL